MIRAALLFAAAVGLAQAATANPVDHKATPFLPIEGANDAVVIVGLAPGPHKIRIELALPDHRVVAGRTVEFTVPAGPAPQTTHCP